MAMPFKKAQSGNPGGRVGIPAEVRELARSHTTAAIKRLAHWMNSDDPRASVAACNALLDRGHGKPQQTLEVTNPSEFDHLSDAEVEAQFTARIIEILRDPEIRQQVVRGLAGVGLSLRDFEEEFKKRTLKPTLGRDAVCSHS
jgi:hypothetical protein